MRLSSFCLGCGNGLTEGERFCGVCGRDSQAGAAAPAVDPGVAFGLAPENSGKAIFSMVSGVLFFVLPFSAAAIVFGHWSLSDIRNSGGRLTGRGFAIVGLVLGYLGVALIVVLVIIGIAYRPGSRSRATTAKKGIVGTTHKTVVMNNENSVVAAVRSLNTAEIAYAQAHRNVGYTCSLSDLAGIWGISGELASGKKNGYFFVLQGCLSAKTKGPVVKYQLLAFPELVRGRPAFCSNESDVIKLARSGSPEECLRAGIDLSETEINHPR
jgi:Domain of unknown function (DUF4190)